MWDLDTILQRNNQAAVDYMMRGRALEESEYAQPRTWSLLLLADKLQVGPPTLSKLLDAFTNFETLESFLSLIREFLPEHEEEILTERNRVHRFCHLFSQKYFSLPSYSYGVNIEQLVSGLPLELLGMSYSAYHELSMREGYLLLLALVVYPFEGDERDLEDDTEFGYDGSQPKGKPLIEVFTGGRIPVLEAARQIVGAEILRLIPSDGWEPSELIKMTDGGPHEGVGIFSQWACSETGSIILDSSYDDCEFVEGSTEPVFKWTRFNVESLTEQWAKLQTTRQKIDDTVEWLEANPTTHFRELLEALTKKAPTTRTKSERPRWDPTETWCPLDQISQWEDEEYEDEERLVATDTT